MPTRGPVVRALTWLGLVCGLVIALASSVLLHGWVVLTVWVVAGLAACVAYGASEAGRAESVAAAWKAGAWTAAVIMLVVGTDVLVGGTVAALVALAAIVQGGVSAWRAVHAQPAAPARPAPAPRRSEGGVASPAPAVRLARADVPVVLLPTSILGSEWLRTTAALGRWMESAERQQVLRRRQEILDELECRDPGGFRRWLAAGPAPHSDPADFVHGRRIMGSDAT